MHDQNVHIVVPDTYVTDGDVETKKKHTELLGLLNTSMQSDQHFRARELTKETTTTNGLTV